MKITSIKNKLFTKKIYAVLIVAFVAISFSCSSTKSISSSSEKNDIKIVELENGIPLYVQKNTSNRKLALAVIVKGGTTYLTPETSGLESALFSMMTFGSKNYDYDTIHSLAYEMGFSITPSASREGAILAMSCIDYYFDKVLPLFSDLFINPSYNQAQYETLMTGYAQSMQQIKTDPQSMLGYEVAQTIFKGHPYATSSAVKPHSIQNITIENMKALHEKDMDARRIMIVAVGNFNENTLADKLNKTFGKIKSQTYELQEQIVPKLEISGEPIVITSEAASGTSYIEKESSGPSVTDDDMIAASIAADIYSQILFNVVREKYGACYTPSASISAMRAGLASVYIYKASDLKNIIKYEKEAQDIFSSGKVIDGKNEDGSYKFASIEERLDGYKNKYINSFYASSVTNGGVASKIANSLLLFGNPYQYDEQIAQVSNVVADDVKNAFKKYWVDNTYRWFAIVGPKDKNSINF